MVVSPLRRATRLLVALALVMSQLVILASSTALGAPGVVVNSTGDLGDADTDDGICDTGGLNVDGDPECTLRAAIEEVNASAADEISFSIPIDDPGQDSSPLRYTITPATPLPLITNEVNLDGSTQPDFSDTPIIELSGASLAGGDGLVLNADSSTIRGMVINGFPDDAIEIGGDFNTIVGNYLGIDVAGTAAVSNGDDGIRVLGVGNFIGGGSEADRNVVSGNLEDGISINGGDDTVVSGNYVGLDVAGAAAIPNAQNGVFIQLGGNDNTVSTGNVISGNGWAGVRVADADDSTIVGSYIGLDAAGTSAIPNGSHGVSVGALAGQVTIGGGGGGDGNVISGNAVHGVDLEFGAGVVTISHNFIGTDAAGSSSVGNGEDGVHADSDGVVIENNVVSGNGTDGLRLERLGAVVRGNLIGTDATGTSPVANADDGIDTGSGTVGSVVGGTGAGDGNVIAFNGDRGITLRSHSGTSAVILGNSIFDNDHLGIDLGGDGVTPNDGGDVDPGPPNELLNYPVITQATETGGDVYIDFDLDVPAGWHRIEFFANPSGIDASGHGEGEILLGSVEVSHPGGGVRSFSHIVPGSAGMELSATTTRCPLLNCPSFVATSEFSQSSTVVVGNHAPVLDPIADQSVDVNATATFTVTASDVDVGDSLAFGLVGEPEGASIDPVTGVFTWTPTEDQGPGTYNFDVTVTDDGSPASLADTQTVTITVDEVNRPSSGGSDQGPTRSTPEQSGLTIDELTELTLDTAPTDATDSVTFGLVGEPEGASIDPATGVFTWTPTEDQGPGTYSFDVTVTDNGIPSPGDTQTITITVNEVNQAPVITSPGDQTNAEGETVILSLAVVDPDQPPNNLSFTATGLPPGLIIDPATGEITGTIPYDAADSPPFGTTIMVSDDGAPSRNNQVTFTWTISDANRPPILDPIPNQTLDEETPVTLMVAATDPDPSDLLAFGLVGEPEGASIDPVTGVFTWTPTEDQGPGTYSFDVTVTDDGSPGSLADTQTVTITVKEVNRQPVAEDDYASTLEDTAVTIDVDANDSDPDFDMLTIVHISSPAFGTANHIGSGAIRYTPAPDVYGPVTFTYTISDGAAQVQATVFIDVVPVNDPPIARADVYRLTTYTPTTLEVLANDEEPEGETIGITLSRLPQVGEVSIEGQELVYRPRNGWTGSVEFGYIASDPHGAESETTVTVVIGDEVLVVAQDLADEVGVGIASFEPPEAGFDPTTVNLISLDGISLLADSFFQTVKALQIPLSFLGLTLVMVVGFGTITEVPTLIFGTRRTHWSIVRLGRQQRLPAYAEPGGRNVIYKYDPTASGIVSLGKIRKVGNTEWLPVDTPNGNAWIYRNYLTEQVDLEAFSADPRPARLVRALARRLRSGQDIGSLVSPEGLVVALTGPPSQIAPDEVATLMNGSRLRHLPGIGSAPTTPAEFTVAVAKPFLEAYDATPEVTASVAHSRKALIPAECWNFPYLALGIDDERVQPWLVFFEYRYGRAWIAGLGIDE